MPVKVISREYKNYFRPETTDWLLGNVGDWLRLTLQLEVSTVFFATDQAPIEIDYVNDAFILSNGESWGQYGFDTGMTAKIRFKTEEDTNGDGNYDSQGVLNSDFVITNIYDNVMEIDQDLQNLGGYTRIPTNLGRKRVTEVLLFSNTPPQGCDITYGHLTNDNSESNNLNSFIDGTTTKFIAPNISGTGNGTVMEAVGMQSGMSILKSNIKSNGTIETEGFNRRYRYTIDIDFLISSFFEDLSNLTDLEIPSYLEGDGSLTDNFIINFYPEWNNPNVIIKNNLSETVRLGNTGWFNENFNELNNDFELLDLDYLDENGAPVESLDYASNTNVIVKLKSLQPINIQSRFVLGFGWIPNNTEDYKNNENTFAENTYIVTAPILNSILPDTFIFTDYQGFGTNGAHATIDNINSTTSGNEIIVNFRFRPNAQFFEQFDIKEDDDRNYYLWIAIDDRDLDSNFSERVTLLLDVNELRKTIPFAGSYDQINTVFFEHHEEIDANGVPNYVGVVQDDILAKSQFRIPKDGSVRFQSMQFGFDVFNMSTEHGYELENVPVDLSQFPVVNNVGEYNVDTIRGFKYNVGNNKNFLKVLRNETADSSTESAYIAFFGSKIRWEDWLQRQDVPMEFFDNQQANNGFNNDWVSYHRTIGYKVYFFVNINAIVDGELTRYKNRFEIDFSDYDENANIETEHRYFRDADNTLLNVGLDPETGKPLGVILSNEKTRIEIDYTRNDGVIWEEDKYYAVTTIEIDKGAGEFEQRQLSTVWESEGDNPLIPVDGEINLKSEIINNGATVKTTCLVDPELLEDAVKYRITGRIGGCSLGIGDGGNDNEGLYEQRYETKYQ